MSTYDHERFDHPFGQVHSLDGQIFYSPNCRREVKIPAPDSAVPKNIFFPPREGPLGDASSIRHYYDFSRLRLQDYLEPRWWTQLWGWTAFIPRTNNFEDQDGIFQCLRPRAILLREYGVYRLSRTATQLVSELEGNIISAVHHLAVLTRTSLICPCPPRSFGYRDWHRRPEAAIEAWDKSRDWFAVWIGLLSYLVAVAQTDEERLDIYPNLRIPNWVTYLLSKGHTQGWLDGVSASVVCSYRLTTARAGVFIQIAPGNSNQPKASWYCRFGIPVWYAWDEPSARRLRLAEIYAPRVSSRVEIQKQGAPLDKLDSHDQESADSGDHSIDQNIVWKQFFAARESKNLAILAQEDDKQRQRRLSREKQPATVSAKVFEWEQDDEGVYQRRAVLGKFKLDTLYGYSRDQRRYDPIRNEYDCCEAFGPADEHPLDTDADDGSDDGSDTDDGPLIYQSRVRESDLEAEPVITAVLFEHENMSNTAGAQGLELYHQDHDAEWVANSISGSISLEMIDTMEAEMLETACLWYGYRPISEKTITPLRDPKLQKALLSYLGMEWDGARVSVFEYISLARLFDFLEQLGTNNSKIDMLDWDLGASHIQSVLLQTRFAAIRQLKSPTTTLFMFDIDDASVDWKLTMTCAAHTLMVCRLDPLLSIYDIARYLLQKGVPFRTLQNSRHIRRAPFDGDHPVKHPIRQPGYKFTVEDYGSYRGRCLQMLHTHRGRAALLLGGNIWRIAVSHVSFDSVLFGPTGWYPDRSKMLVVTVASTGEEFIDDQLTEDEVDVLCGLNYCLTGAGEQVAKQTWYPRPKTFQYSGHDYGRWTDVSERKFNLISKPRDTCTVLGDSEQNASIKIDRQPISVNKWRDIVRGSGNFRRLNLSHNKKAEDFVSTHCTATLDVIYA